MMDGVCYPVGQEQAGEEPGLEEQEAFFRLLEEEGDELGPARRLALAEAHGRGERLALTSSELAFAGRLAWRNSTRCIGRLFWRTLHVRDLRHLETEDEIYEALVDHLRVALNGGAIRSVLTVFGPAGGRGELRIWNHQLLRYAGYRQPNGTILGDPHSVAFTDHVLALGWEKRERSSFDLLPWVIQLPGRTPRVYEFPAEMAMEVPLSHPRFPWFEKLGLKWYAVPVISDMCFDAGGYRFPAAPFNGWYMGTEIGARNLADEKRYNLLPVVAEKMELDTSSERTLWKDRALIELNQAVLHSFQRHGIKLVDHHTAAQEFMLFAEKEKRAGRAVAGEWSWLVPPLSGSTTPVFHRRWEDRVEKPNFFYQPKGWKLAASTAAEISGGE